MAVAIVAVIGVSGCLEGGDIIDSESRSSDEVVAPALDPNEDQVVDHDGVIDPGAVVSGEPAEPSDSSIDRVTSEAERARMVEYVESQYPDEAIVNSFTTSSGDEIDCVDMYQQPALQRAELARHEIELRPRTLPDMGAISDLSSQRRVREELAREALPSEQEYLLTGEFDDSGERMACPEGTVPIRRLTMDTLSRFESVEDFRRKVPSRFGVEDYGARFDELGDGNAPRRQGSTDHHQYAHAYRYVDNMGAESRLNLWNPYTEKSSEFSLSQIWIVRGSGSNRETVETGWQKYKDLYGDWYSRLFIYFTPDNYGNGGCYNLSCGAFVQVSNSVVIGGKYSSYSVKNGSQYEARLFWYKDGVNGHWWLKHGDTWVGYYPRSLFDSNGLRDRAAIIDFGGEIIDTQGDGVHTRTDMGSGYFASLGWQQAAYQRNIRYVDTGNVWREADNLTATQTDWWCYDIDLKSGGSWGNYFYFGGSGYNTYCK